MEQLDGVPPDEPVGTLLRAFRRRACLSQEQLAARAELSERTVRNLEAGRERSPHNDTVRLLADALELGDRERESWFAALTRSVAKPVVMACPRSPLTRSRQPGRWRRCCTGGSSSNP